MNYFAETVDRLTVLRHLPMVITSAPSVDVCMQYLSFASLRLFFGDLAIAVILDVLYGLSITEPPRPMFVIFILTKYFLHSFARVLGFLIRTCELYESSSKKKISPDQTNQISNLFAKKSTSDTGSVDLVKNTPKSGLRSSTDTAVTSQTMSHRKSSSLFVTDFDSFLGAGTTHQPCS